MGLGFSRARSTSNHNTTQPKLSYSFPRASKGLKLQKCEVEKRRRGVKKNGGEEGVFIPA